MSLTKTQKIEADKITQMIVRDYGKTIKKLSKN